MSQRLIAALFTTMIMLSCAVQNKRSSSTPKEIPSKASCGADADFDAIKEVMQECVFANPHYHWSLAAMEAPAKATSAKLKAKLLEDLESTSFTDLDLPDTTDSYFETLTYVTKNYESCQKQSKMLDDKYEVFVAERMFRDEFEHARAQAYIVYMKSRVDSDCWIRAAIGGEKEFSN
jgi:hypothetical protein